MTQSVQEYEQQGLEKYSYELKTTRTMKTAVEWLYEQMPKKIQPHYKRQLKQAKEMEREQKIAFAKLHVQKALKAVENEMILSASAVKHWYLPETIK